MFSISLDRDRLADAMTPSMPPDASVTGGSGSASQDATAWVYWQLRARSNDDAVYGTSVRRSPPV